MYLLWIKCTSVLEHKSHKKECQCKHIFPEYSSQNPAASTAFECNLFNLSSRQNSLEQGASQYAETCAFFSFSILNPWVGSCISLRGRLPPYPWAWVSGPLYFPLFSSINLFCPLSTLIGFLKVWAFTVEYALIYVYLSMFSLKIYLCRCILS